MSRVPVEVKRLPNGAGLPLPKYQTEGAAAMDLHAAKAMLILPDSTRAVETGLAMAIPDGYELQIRSRSGLASRGIFVTNGPGTVDSDYRGEIKVLITNTSGGDFHINRGDRIAQAALAPVTLAEMKEVEELSATERGEGGFGSTGG